MRMTDVEFEKLFAAAVIRAAELDYEELPTDDEIYQIVRPSQQAQRKMNALLRNPSDSDRYFLEADRTHGRDSFSCDSSKSAERHQHGHDERIADSQRAK